MTFAKASAQLAADARAAASTLARSSGAARDAAIRAMAEALLSDQRAVLSANQEDVERAKASGLSAAFVDRLTLTAERLAGVADALLTIANLDDPLGQVIEQTTRPNGLNISRVTVPLGVIGIIYESRPNVTADAAAICLKAGNAVVLRGGSDSARTARAMVASVRRGIAAAGLPADVVQMTPDQDRHWVGALLAGLDGGVDVVVPRGGRSLVERVQADARVPVIGHLEGLCHTYVHRSAELAMVKDIVVNAKLRRTGICGALETLLIDARWPAECARDLLQTLHVSGCELRGDESIVALHDAVLPATAADWTTEYLAPVLSIAQVADTAGAIAHIEQFGSGHTDAILAADLTAAERFLRDVDSAIVMHNTSTQFADGGEFGLGAEIGIATGKLHARGPVGARELTSYKHVVRGSGQTRA